MTCWLLLEDDRLVDSGCEQWTVVGNVLDLLWCWPGKEMMWTWPAKDDVKSHQDHVKSIAESRERSWRRIEQ